MQRYDTDTTVPEAGRVSAVIAGKLREAIIAGKYVPGDFLPSVRKLMASTGSASATARRALRILQSNGLVVAEKKGYRVLAGATEPERGCPLAFVVHHEPGQGTEFMKAMFDAFREATSRRGWSLLSQATEGMSAQQVVAQLRAARSSGVILDTHDLNIIEAVRASGLPAIMADAWHEDYGLDAVLQDGHLGGVRAAKYLAAQGCRRVGWFGGTSRSAHDRYRFGGAMAGIAAEGLPIIPGLLVDPGEDMPSAAREYLSRRDRPDGVISLWTETALALKKAGDDLGLAEGRDYHLVGWCPEELYETHWSAKFGGGRAVPAITWSMRTMVEAVLERLRDRRANPGLPALRVSVPARLRLAEDQV